MNMPDKAAGSAGAATISLPIGGMTSASGVGRVPVAAGLLYPSHGILLPPIFATGAKALPSVFVLGNALRQRRFRAPLAASGSANQGTQS